VPHPGFDILRRFAERLPEGGFVFTSNVDGHFTRAGFAAERISECHGSIHYLQCLDDCRQALWPADDFVPQVDEEKALLLSDFPVCPHCQGLARPNILMFGDWGWNEARAAAQDQCLRAWLRRVERLLVIEVGAGTQIPTVRRLGESLSARLIRINPDEPQLGATAGISLACGALAGLRQIETQLNQMDTMT
jgi:NAD-dependent SIR2 family protein deacetylase